MDLYGGLGQKKTDWLGGCPYRSRAVLALANQRTSRPSPSPEQTCLASRRTRVSSTSTSPSIGGGACRNTRCCRRSRLRPTSGTRPRSVSDRVDVEQQRHLAPLGAGYERGAEMVIDNPMLRQATHENVLVLANPVSKLRRAHLERRAVNVKSLGVSLIQRQYRRHRSSSLSPLFTGSPAPYEATQTAYK